MTERIVRRRMVFRGTVQGVGFRWRACHAARLYGCTGWVENAWDGSVIMEIQGSEDRIGQVIRAVERGAFVQIEQTESASLPPVDGERDFCRR